MKRILSILLTILLLTVSFTAFAEPAARIGALKGPTAMGMVGMMRDCADRYAFTVEGAADALTPALVRGDLDIAAVPANLASILYNNTEGVVKVLAINTLGVLYIVERGDTIHSLEDLRGRTLFSAGKGSTPEYALNYLLRENGLNPETDLTLEYKSEHAECLSAMMADETAVAMLPQPFATVAMSKSPDMRVALDLNAEWNALQADTEAPSALVTGVVVARSAFIEEHPETVKAFLEDYAASVDFTQTYLADAAALIGEFGIFEAAVAEKALPYCSITFIAGEDMIPMLSGYLSVLYRQNPAAVGGTLPDDAFYYRG